MKMDLGFSAQIQNKYNLQIQHRFEPNAKLKQYKIGEKKDGAAQPG